MDRVPLIELIQNFHDGFVGCQIIIHNNVNINAIITGGFQDSGIMVRDDIGTNTFIDTNAAKNMTFSAGIQLFIPVGVHIAQSLPTSSSKFRRKSNSRDKLNSRHTIKSANNTGRQATSRNNQMNRFRAKTPKLEPILNPFLGGKNTKTRRIKVKSKK